MSRELFDALVDQAELRRLPVAVHLYYLDDARYALEAGADLIAHSIRDAAVGAEFIDQMQNRPGLLRAYLDPGSLHVCV